MFTAIGSGILLGLFISFLIGPVFFSLIQTSIRQGLKRAMIFEIGTLLSDTSVLLLCYFGLSRVIESAEYKEKYQYAVAIVGAIVIFLFGLYPIIKKKKPHDQSIEPLPEKSNAFVLISKAFLLNTINPSVIVFWVLQVGAAVQGYGGNKLYITTHFATTLIVMVGIDFLKAWGANRIKKYLRPRTYTLIAYIEGGLLIIFSIIILVKTFWL